MSANGANFRSLGANYDVTAVAALPNLNLALLKDLLGLHVVQESAVSVLVALLDGSYETELGCEYLEAFFLGGLCKAFIHICPLIVLASGCSSEVFCCRAYAFECLKP